jgi:hypothetical protein
MDNGKRVTRSNSSHAELAPSLPPATKEKLPSLKTQLADLKSRYEVKRQ